MATTYTEAVLNKLSKSELVQLVLQTEASLDSQFTDLTTAVKDLLRYFRELDCLTNSHYSRQNTIEVIGIPSCIRDQNLEDKVRNIFGEIGVNIDERDIQACHQLRKKDRMIVKFVNRKDCINILRVKKELKHLDPCKLFFLEGTKILINESLCPYYRGIWNKCKKLRENQILHQFFGVFLFFFSYFI